MLITGLILQLALAMEPIHQTLTAPMDVWDVTAQDLDEDGLLDLVAFYGERDGSKDKKGLYVYLARRDGKYPTKPSFTFPLNADTGNAFFTERDGRRELVVSTKTGATRYVYQKNAFAEAGRYAFVSLLPAHTRKPIFLRNVSHDLDGDGSDEWIIPVLGGFDIWGGEEKMAFLEGEIRSESYWYGGLNIHHRIPRVYVFKRPGEKNQAIGFTSEDGAIFHYGANWEASHRHEITGDLEDQWEARTELADVNDDGRPDLMTTTSKGTTNIEVHTRIYLADTDLGYADKPSFELKSKGGLAIPYLVDLNNDEKLDLVVRSFPITLRNIANYLLRKKISLKIETYLFKNGGYAKKPSYSNYVTADISEGREEISFANGDFDGDGAKDVAVGARSSSLSIFTHGKGGVIGSRAWKTINVHTFGIARTADLDDSGTDDIVIFHPLGKYQKEIKEIRF
ncbi:MAG: VCBS repeat-containing protein [Candidatus Hydrogenedentota bacterium]